jgi:hypothetical protein
MKLPVTASACATTRRTILGAMFAAPAFGWAAGAAGPVMVGIDGEFGLQNSISAQAIELGVRIALAEINGAGGVLGERRIDAEKSLVDKYLKLQAAGAQTIVLVANDDEAACWCARLPPSRRASGCPSPTIGGDRREIRAGGRTGPEGGGLHHRVGLQLLQCPQGTPGAFHGLGQAVRYQSHRAD